LENLDDDDDDDDDEDDDELDINRAWEGIWDNMKA
jgi:hypothetical protein